MIIADITGAKSIAGELQAIIPNLPSVPVQPLLHAKSNVYATYEHFNKCSSVLDIFCYSSTKQLLASLEDHIIAPAERRIKKVSKG